jgi:Fe-S cluster assembly protein SufD
VPPASPAVDGDVAKGPFDGLAADEILFVNGRQRHAATRRRGRRGGPALRLGHEGAAHAAAYAIVVEPDTTLVLLESHEGRAGGYFSDVTLDIAVGEGAASSASCWSTTMPRPSTWSPPRSTWPPARPSTRPS